MSRTRHIELIALLDGVIHHTRDHIVLMDLGPAEGVKPRVVSLGKTLDTIERAHIII